MSADNDADAPASRKGPAGGGAAGPWLRVGIAGALMGWANLVPGVSGGTMLLVCGVYRDFVDAVSDLSRLRWRRDALLWMAALVASAGAAVLLSAGAFRDAVETYPVVMYSLFAGLTLGGVPSVLRRTGPMRSPVWVAALIAFGAMVALAFLRSGEGAATGPLLALVAGGVGASAMVLPGLSGSYLLLLLGQYASVLGSIDSFRRAALDPLIRGGAVDVDRALDALVVLGPFALGVAAGVALVSQLIRRALTQAPATTYGALLGLLLGAVPGLWPFRGVPSLPDAGLAAAALLVGLGLALALARLDPGEEAEHI